MQTNVSGRRSSRRRPAQVVKREILWQGGTVEVTVPYDALRRKFNDGGTEVRYLQFPRGVRGGLINCFVRTDNPALIGETIVAEIEIVRKDLEDGRSFLYIDLYPAERESQITHRLATGPDEPGKRWGETSYQVFRTPEPLKGFILVAPKGRAS